MFLSTVRMSLLIMLPSCQLRVSVAVIQGARLQTYDICILLLLQLHYFLVLINLTISATLHCSCTYWFRVLSIQIFPIFNRLNCPRLGIVLVIQSRYVLVFTIGRTICFIYFATAIMKFKIQIWFSNDHLQPVEFLRKRVIRNDQMLQIVCLHKVVWV